MRTVVGCDVEDVARWREPRRLEQLFTKTEHAHAQAKVDPAPTYAGLWCAREAAWKALSQVLPDLGLRELSVVHDGRGRPSISLSRADGEEWAARVSLSISHTPTTAFAVAVVDID